MEDTFSAHHVGLVAHQAFVKHEGSVLGKSLEVFPNSVYVRTLDGELLNFTRRTVKSPININFTGQGSVRKQVEPRRAAHVENGTCYVDRMCVELDNAKFYYPKPRTTPQITKAFEELSRDLLSAAFQIGVLYSQEGVLDRRSWTYDSFARFIETAIRSLGRHDNEAFAKAATGIVGLGTGFTPAGDDLLAGFLGVFNTFAPALRYEPVILSPSILARTTWVSGKLLDYTQRGLFDEEFDVIIEALLLPNGEALVDALQNLAARGHSSGLDLCSGAILGAAMVFDLAFSGGLTRKVTARLGYTAL